MVSKAANAPVFGISDTYLGHGIVGGYVLNFAEQGKIAARMVLDIFRGKSPRDIPIQISPGVYLFDWRELQRWGLPEGSLPPGSIVLFREPSLWQRAKWIIIASILYTEPGFLGCLSALQPQTTKAGEGRASPA